MPKNLIIFIIALILSLIFTPLVRLLAVKLNIMDRPNSIKTHREPVAYLGGVAIYLAFILAIIMALVIRLPFNKISVIIIGATLIMILGLVDDLRPLSFKTKLFLEVLIATLLIIFDIRIKFITPDYIAVILTILWVIGVTNALNIIDIMDGLSSGVAVIAALAFLFINPPSEQTYVNYTAAALAGAALGFLRYNFPPAKIFMGDTGSLMLGFVLAVLSIGTSYTQVNNIALYAPILILGIPIYDTFLVMILRFKQGKNIFHGSLDHFALRLERLGFSRRKVVIIAYIVSVCLSTAALMISKVHFRWAVAIYILVALFSISIGFNLSKVDMEKSHPHE
jgi:UDP-GlcNAc:undecaprenyl-phosphate/decaprenyl-phosphate GlcNAc-1-phosphate transferase